MADIEGFHPSVPQAAPPHAPRATLAAARAARIDAELAGCEIEEITAALNRKPPVGRWPRLAQAAFGPSVAVLSA